jgi:hypothetical protein
MLNGSSYPAHTPHLLTCTAPIGQAQVWQIAPPRFFRDSAREVGEDRFCGVQFGKYLLDRRILVVITTLPIHKVF